MTSKERQLEIRHATQSEQNARPEQLKGPLLGTFESDAKSDTFVADGHAAMAKVAGPMSARAFNRQVLDKVFPQQTRATLAKSIIQQTPTKPSPDITKTFEGQIRNHLRFLVGIGSASYIYGWDETFNGEPFRLPLSACAPMEEVRISTPEEVEAHCAKLSQSEVWQMLSSLKRRSGMQHTMQLVAPILHDLIAEFVLWAYTGLYRHDLTDHLRFWVEHVLSLVVDMAEIAITDGHQKRSPSSLQKAVSRNVDTAITKLGALRVKEMYEVIATQENPDAMIEGLKHYTTGVASRTYLTDRFNEDYTRHALHPGRSTIEILRLYISTIKFFRKLEPKGVLLDKVAKRVRRYLRDRDDTVKVVVSGLLSDPDGLTNDPEVLTELASELHRPEHSDNEVEDNDLDWDNMEWLPDPADAAPDYMKSRNTDVIGSLISLFDSKEVFVKELQAVFAERLLENKNNFMLEVNILHHLKLRLGDSALQSCEVMLRDVLDSVKMNATINKNGSLAIQAKVLSRLFWPTMSEQTFELPPEIEGQQLAFESSFEKYKSSRNLTWVPSLGSVDIELELEDRTVRESVLPYQASVIYAFQQDDHNDSTGTRKVSKLAEKLSMLPALVRSACIFWLSKRVLEETAPETYTVLETISDKEDIMMGGADPQQEATTAAAEAAAAQAAREAEEEERAQKMAVYHQFVVSMLTNQGAMPLARIAMMLNIVVPGGFPFNNEELKDFLTSMVKDGQLEVGPGGNYKAIS